MQPALAWPALSRPDHSSASPLVTVPAISASGQPTSTPCFLFRRQRVYVFPVLSRLGWTLHDIKYGVHTSIPKSMYVPQSRFSFKRAACQSQPSPSLCRSHATMLTEFEMQGVRHDVLWPFFSACILPLWRTSGQPRQAAGPPWVRSRKTLKPQTIHFRPWQLLGSLYTTLT
ncbi:hypothetical protein LZ31DRAFT_548265 [Colletotrichum somersetense]|nr:hypothetical protein LZ31DRAFT_548265 [Colletotrichum somersetense]